MALFVLWTHPRCCGTAFELWVRARGDLEVRTNVYDYAYYHHEGRGMDRHPGMVARPEYAFDRIHASLRAEARRDEVFLRNAAYAVRYHQEPELWRDVHHAFLVRDPRYALPSHRERVEVLTEEEAGYAAQWELFSMLEEELNEPPIVIDAHELLGDPKGMLRAYCRRVGWPWIPDALTWRPGMRSNWGLWSHWKEKAARSTGFDPFVRSREREKEGEKDPLYPACVEYYRRLRRWRLRPP